MRKKPKSNSGRARASLPLAFALALIWSPANAGWTFCIAEGHGGKDYWLTDVFSATRERERLEGDFKTYLSAHGEPESVVQCPAPKGDRTEMVNAQFTAAEFHRKLGDTLHEVVAPEFGLRR